jgi:hypothetical protein
MRDYEELIHKLDSFTRAYPADIFVPLSDTERGAVKPSTITRISAEMGRHFGRFAAEARDAIKELTEAQEKRHG